MIRVFPNRLEGEPIETHHTLSPMTVKAWLATNAPRCDTSMLSLHINGQPASLTDEFGPDDTLDIHIEPQGATLIIAAVVGVVVAAAMIALMPTPATPRAQRQGRGLDATSLDANVVRFGEPIPEVFGRPPRIYPDYLLPTRTYYQADNPRIQWIEALLCVSKGRLAKSEADVYIGDTRAVALGADVELAFFEPGQSLASRTEAEWWHTPREVGFTSRGGGGLELGTITDRTASMPQGGFVVNGTILFSTNAFPEDWGTGVTLNVEVPFPATVSGGNRIETAQGLLHFTPSPGQIVSISGFDDEGDYEVASYTPPSGGTPADPGSPSSFTGDSPPARLDFGTTPGSLSIGYGGTLSVLLSSNYVDAAELALAIASQLNNTGLTATLESGVIAIVEQAPHTGQTITVTGASAVDVFGSDPVAVTGDPATPAIPGSGAAITLVGADLPSGNYVLAIGPEGHRYTVSSAPTTFSRVMSAPGYTFTGWSMHAAADIQVLLDPGSQSTGWTGPFSVAPQGETVTAIEIDYVFPRGLIHYNKKGRKRAISATVYVQWREIGESAWTSVSYTHTLAEVDGLGYTQRIDLPEAMPVEVQVRRSPKLEWDNTQEDIQWTALRGRMTGAPTSYAGVTTLAVKLRTGDRLSTQSDNRIWLKATRMLPAVEDPETLIPTRDIIPSVLHMLESVGYTRNRVDMTAAEELHAIWSARQDYWDYTAKDSSTIKTLANHALKAGFAELVTDRGLVKPVRDALRDQPDYIYSPQEFTDYPTLTTRMPEPDEVDGVDAEFVDQLTGRTETIKYRLPTDQGRRAQKISLIGVTDWTKAWRLAARHRRTLAYRRTIFKGETELHALNSGYMSYDRIQDGIPGYGQSAFVVTLTGSVLRVSEPMDWGADAGFSRVIAFRQMDGRLTAPQWVTQGATEYELVLTEPPATALHFGGDNRDPTMVYFGNVRNWSHEVLVTAIKPGRDNRVTIEGVEYDDRVYADDDRDPQNEVLLTTATYVSEHETSELYTESE